MLAATWSAIGLLAGALGYRWRHHTLRLCAVVVLTVVALLVALATTGDVAPVLVGDATKILVGTVLLSLVAVLLTVRALPRLSSRRDRGSVTFVCCALAGGYLVVAMFLTTAADEHLRVGQLPQLRTRDEFLARRDGPEQLGAFLWRQPSVIGIPDPKTSSRRSLAQRSAVFGFPEPPHDCQTATSWSFPADHRSSRQGSPHLFRPGGGPWITTPAPLSACCGIPLRLSSGGTSGRGWVATRRHHRPDWPIPS